MNANEIHAHLDRIAEILSRLDSLDLSKLGDKRTAATIVARAGGRTVITEAFIEAHRRCSEHAGRGYPANTRANPTGRSAGHGDSPTERAAEQRDEFDKDLKLAESALRRIRRDIADLERFTIRNLAPTADADTALIIDCASCLRIDKHTDVYRTPRTIEGVPAKPLCRWCYDHALAVGVWPPEELLADHHAGRRLKVRG